MRPPHWRERSFGLSVGSVLLLIAAVLFWRGRIRGAEIVAALGACLVVLGYAAPAMLKWPSAVWWRLAMVLGYVNARVILTVAFVLILTPMGLIWRLIGRDPMTRRRDRRPGWVPHPERYRNPDHFRRMY
jgi:hypothetical protein